jgi:hypothetical protein
MYAGATGEIGFHVNNTKRIHTMQQRFINFMSISLLVITAAQAAASSDKALVELPKFKQEADFPKADYRLAGLMIGGAQQAAMTVLLPRYVLLTEAMDGIFVHWLGSLWGSFCAHAKCAQNIQHLTAHKTACARMIFNKLALNPNPHVAATRDDLLQHFIKEYKAGKNHTANVRNAYNDLLESKSLSENSSKLKIMNG